MANPVRTRFAPSPTGYMHVGNLRTALYTYLQARHNGGTFILRIEDTDQGRLVEGATDIIYNTLRATGLTWDEGPDIGGPVGPYVQSQRMGMFKQYAEQLVAEGKAYYCFCTKERLESIHQDGEFGGYDRHCRDLPAEEIRKNLDAGMPYVIRQRVPLEGSTSFEDAVYGTITIENKEIEDQVLLKSDGYPTYNFANVIDDHLMHITHVVRGCEYLTSTPKYNMLYDAFGWEKPIYVHLPLIMGKNEDGLTSIRYDYFNLDDKNIFRDHEPLIAPAPPCPDGNHFYYREKKLSFTKLEDVYKRALQAAKKGREFTFHWRGGYLTREVLADLVDQIQAAGKTRDKKAIITLNWPQAVLRFHFVEQQAEGKVFIEEVNEGEKL